MGAHFHLTLVTHSRGLPWFFLLILKFSWIISHVCVTRHRSRSCHPRQTSWSGQPPWKWFLSRIPYNDHLRSWCSSPNSSKVFALYDCLHDRVSSSCLFSGASSVRSMTSCRRIPTPHKSVKMPSMWRACHKLASSLFSQSTTAWKTLRRTNLWKSSETRISRTTLIPPCSPKSISAMMSWILTTSVHPQRPCMNLWCDQAKTSSPMQLRMLLVILIQTLSLLRHNQRRDSKENRSH